MCTCVQLCLQNVEVENMAEFIFCPLKGDNKPIQMKFGCNFTIWVYSGIPNLVPIGQKMGTGIPKFQNLVKFAVFLPCMGNNRLYTDDGEIWHGTTYHGSTLMPNLALLWDGGGYRSPTLENLLKSRFLAFFAPHGDDIMPIKLKFDTEACIHDPRQFWGGM